MNSKILMTKFLSMLALATASLFLSSSQAAAPQNVGFYYGGEAPVGTLMAYDWLVLQSDRTSPAHIDALNQTQTLPLAYVSAGEIARSHELFPTVPRSWILAANPAWDSVVLDLRLPEVQDFLLDRLIAPALARGFKGVFLDTLDSFTLAPDVDAEAFADAQDQLIHEIRNRHPDAKILINRGFHLPESAHAKVDAVVVESYRQGYDPVKKRYRAVTAEDRDWLDQQLSHWRKRHPEVPLIAIDYLEDPSQALALTQQLREDGFLGYVSDPDLVRLGPTLPRQVQRHVLTIYDSPSGRISYSAAHRQGAVLLEQLGYVPEYQWSGDPIPEEPTADRYAGIMVWWEAGLPNAKLCNWLLEQQAAGLPVVVFGVLPGNSPCQALIATETVRVPTGVLNTAPLHSSVGEYEGKRLPLTAFNPLPQPEEATPWLTVRDELGDQYTPVYTHAGGGAALAPYLLEPGPDGQQYWLFDPMAFLRQALGPASFPVVDTTTESGRRILTAHIDGDGFISRSELPGTPLAGDVIDREILARYSIPHTVSVIEAETSPEGLHPETSAEAEEIARTSFRREHVEIASHSYSHPYFWRPIEADRFLPEANEPIYGYFLPIPDYKPVLEREIDGSVRYIRERLAPPGKPVSVFLWTGDAQAGPEAVGRTREAGLININGGNTHPLPNASELAGVWPMALPLEDELQIYAPVMNENVYTNLWQGPYFGFRDVIQTFEILEDKGRLKPISIYYHYYSGTKPEALHALREIYDYALSQPVTPLFLSEYAERAQTVYRSALLQDEDGAWFWRGIAPPHTVRIDPATQFPDLDRSSGAAGFHDVAGHRYVHLTGADPRLVLQSELPSGPYLREANAVLTHWSRRSKGDGWELTFGFRGYQPIEFVLAGTSSCRAIGEASLLQLTPDSGSITGNLPIQNLNSLTLECV